MRNGEVVEAVCPTCSSPLMKVVERAREWHEREAHQHLVCLQDGCKGTAPLTRMRNNGE